MANPTTPTQSTASQWLTLLPMVIQLISLAAQTLPAGSMGGSIPKYLNLLATIVGQGAKAYDQLTHLRDLVVLMVQEKREPTEDEWSAWEIRSGLAHSRIQDYDIDAEEGTGDDV